MKLPSLEACETEYGKKIDGDPIRIARIEETVRKTLADYNMLSPTDKIMVAVSGGKDSTVLLYLLHKFGYNVQAVTVDAHIGCYSEINLRNIQKFCADRQIPLSVASFNDNYGSSVCYITEVLKEKGQALGTCTVCGVLRRQLLNKAARELGATKIALGHNLDDESQVYLMNLLRNRQSLNARLGPVPGIVSDDAFVQRIKPLYFISEDDVTHYSQAHGFPVKYGECPCSVDSFRYGLKKFIKASEETYPDLKTNLLKYFIAKLPSLREKYKTDEKPNSCTQCGEPAATTICRSCDILQKFKAPAQN